MNPQRLTSSCSGPWNRIAGPRCARPLNCGVRRHVETILRSYRRLRHRTNRAGGAIALFSPAFNGEVGAIAAGSVFLYFFALVPTIVLGVPAFLILLRLNLVRWWSSAVGGA